MGSQRRTSSARPRIGVDTGGTFTDLVRLGGAGDEIETGKLPSTPDDPARAVLEGISALDTGRARQRDVVHGSTVALNAILTGAGGRVALVTNEGFRDLIEIGRQERPDIYALHPVKPAPLVSRELRFEVAQRSWPDEQGELIEVARPSRADLDRLRAALADSGAESIAVCLLHAYADPEIERRVAEALAPLGLPVTCSAQILPAYRETERYSTAVVNAALVPVMRDYLERLGGKLDDARLFIMQNSGGTLAAERAAHEPVRVLFSGPAGGVVGGARAAAEAGFEDIVTLDMGGTSTDVAFHTESAGLLNTVTDARIGGHPVAVPSLDIHTIGCGGGSIVTVDAGGVLHVGPESAGADPGPVAYGRGTEPTVTDAHFFLGHIDQAPGAGFLGGALDLDRDAVARAFETLGQRLGTQPQAAAQAVLDVARAAMRRAVSVMTMQRGRDPDKLPLVAFGGAGGLSAAALAASLDMPGALVPCHPGVLSAHGMATADAVSDHARTILAPLSEWKSKERRRAFRELGDLGRAELVAAGHAARSVEHELTLDLRYRGQSYEIAVPEGDDPGAAFERRHAKLYGWKLDEGTVELVQLAARAVARAPRRSPAAGRRRPAPKRAFTGERSAFFAGRGARVPRVERAALAPGHVLQGPAIIEEFSGTTILPPRWKAEVRAGGHLWLTPQ